MSKLRTISGIFAAMFMAGTAHAADNGALPDWAAPLNGTKLTAVDGSSAVVDRGDGSFSLTRTSPGGASQSESFALLADRLGTISADGGHVIGFFRVTDNSIEAQYADGRSESLFINGGGGISLALHSAESTCLSWYPADHVFSAAERRAAVAAYAASLGIDQPSKSKVSPAQTCAPEAKHVAVATHAAAAHYTIADSAPAGLLATLVPVAVRVSDVHVVPELTATKPAVTVAAVTAAPPPAPALTIAQPAKADAAPAIVPAPPAKVATQTASTDLSAQLGRGASDCLHVESDGANLGFRNHCLFNVEFVYCLQSKDDPRAVCNIETHNGTVPANGFAPLLSDANIKPQDAEHDFRWVACSGTPKDVTAYLDSAEPPSGRCVRLNAS